MISFAKGVTSGYVPLGGVFVSERIARHFDNNVLWAGVTYCGLRGRLRQPGLVDRARRLAERHPMVGDVRGKGLFGGVELVKDRGTKEPVAPSSRGGPSPMKKFLEGVLERGTYLMARYNVFLVAPPLVIAEDEIEEGIRAVDGALDEIGAKGGAAGGERRKAERKRGQ